ncbi:diguanylate cyclase domain-containing protein [Lacipirellula limnantheis]|uniref:diguanylate cyclase n=1 Tax=Lacipirellula limnantheis TaxID=2528024 RepID=A0A517U0A3_9BACT|nr:diguanylate cyclase [Lacipirellula limnantheis]QDT74059.1 Response regulator PleD [Lacipirellula limnantheis]
MPETNHPAIDSAAASPAPPDPRALSARRRLETESRVAEISSLLSALEEATAEPKPASRPAKTGPSASPATPAARPVDHHQNSLVQVRLGLASGLYTALQHKHPPTASHSLRVALGCSTWALYKRLDDETRDAVEAASLLHDVGKISVPDAVLTKTSRLSPEEEAMLQTHWEAGVHILACCCSSQRVLDAVRYAGRRFDGSGAPSPVGGDDLPLESRMIAIVDAFDQMTTSASAGDLRTREAALHELFVGAGTLYDPILVNQFIELLSHDQELLTQQVAGRWLNELGKRQTELPWSTPTTFAATPVIAPAAVKDNRSLFEQQLIDSMHDGVIFVDEQRNIFLWSKGAERLTGVSSAAAQGRQFTPSLLDMCNTAGRRVRDDACPVARSIATHAQLRQRLEILGRQGEHVAIDLHAIPVVCRDGQLRGATVLLQDAQPEVSLEEKCEALHAEVTKDPMTKVANRAEFDRMLALFIEAHEQAGLPCSLIMTDIDHFKNINDTFGHQAGDEAIITVANLLTQACRSGDLVARYGGEEFAVLCADCTMADSAARAEQIRKKIAEATFHSLGTRKITSSFGVAQLQSGDTPETLLRRSDSALLMAKEQGRNQVVQLGNAMEHARTPKKKWWNFGLFRAAPLIEAKLTTEVPIDIAIEKLRGFVTDQQAKIISIRDNRVEIEISSDRVGQQRRKADRPSPYRLELEFSEDRLEKTNSFGLAAGSYAQTVVNVSIRPKKRRNRRRDDQLDRAKMALQSLKSYLMAREVDAEPPRPSSIGAR